MLRGFGRCSCIQEGPPKSNAASFVDKLCRGPDDWAHLGGTCALPSGIRAGIPNGYRLCRLKRRQIVRRNDNLWSSSLDRVKTARQFAMLETVSRPSDPSFLDWAFAFSHTFSDRPELTAPCNPFRADGEVPESMPRHRKVVQKARVPSMPEVSRLSASPVALGAETREPRGRGRLQGIARHSHRVESTCFWRRARRRVAPSSRSAWPPPLPDARCL
jgi:hypothetical protein